MNLHLRLSVAIIVPGVCSISAFGQSGPNGHAVQITQAAESLRPKLIEQRRDFHMHPELSNREERTARVIAARLRALSLDGMKTNVAGHGVVALLKGAKPGPVVAIRADIDALPITETLDVAYRSLTPGVKHACGHDVHTAVALGVAEVLSGMRDRIPGTIKFIFQPAEEGPPAGEEGGARLMIKEGALEDPRPLAIFGLHCSPEIEVGKIGVRAGAAQASADNFDITIRGQIAHAAAPHKGVDAILVAAECVTALQSIHSRRVDTFEPLILTVGTIHGGQRRNSIASEVKLEGTLRTLSEDVRQRVKELIQEMLAGVTAAHGAKQELRFTEITRVVHNEPWLVEETLPVMRRTLGETNVVAVPLRMGAEDFSYFQEIIPGFYFRLGVGNQARGITADTHTPEFDVDEECLVVGTKVMANVLLDFLERHGN